METNTKNEISPKVSVIIPVYNVEQYLRECLDSVVNQTLRDIEIICVNDGSPDNSLAILEEYASKDKRIKIINKENGGISSARNCAIPLAKGEYIGFVDSDDWIDLDFYEKLYNTAKRYKAEVACTNLYRVYEKEGFYFVKQKRIKYSSRVSEKYRLANVPKANYVMNKVYHTKKLQKSGVLFEDGVLYEDVLWSHKVIYYLKGLVTVPGTKYNYRDNPYSVVNTKSERSIQEHAKAFRRALSFVNCNYIHTNNQEWYMWDERHEYKIFGIPVLTIKKYYGIFQVFLFGKILFFEVKKNYRNIDPEENKKEKVCQR